MDVNSDHVNGRPATVTRVVEEIATHGDSCAVRVLLLWAIIYTNSGVRDITFAVMWNVLAVDESNFFGTFADSGDALSEMSEVLCVGFAPQFLVLGVH